MFEELRINWIAAIKFGDFYYHSFKTAVENPYETIGVSQCDNIEYTVAAIVNSPSPAWEEIVRYRLSSCYNIF